MVTFSLEGIGITLISALLTYFILNSLQKRAQKKDAKRKPKETPLHQPHSIAPDLFRDPATVVTDDYTYFNHLFQILRRKEVWTNEELFRQLIAYLGYGADKSRQIISWEQLTFLEQVFISTKRYIEGDTTIDPVGMLDPKRDPRSEALVNQFNPEVIDELRNILQEIIRDLAKIPTPPPSRVTVPTKPPAVPVASAAVRDTESEKIEIILRVILGFFKELNKPLQDLEDANLEKASRLVEDDNFKMALGNESLYNLLVRLIMELGENKFDKAFDTLHSFGGVLKRFIENYVVASRQKIESKIKRGGILRISEIGLSEQLESIEHQLDWIMKEINSLMDYILKQPKAILRLLPERDTFTLSDEIDFIVEITNVEDKKDYGFAVNAYTQTQNVKGFEDLEFNDRIIEKDKLRKIYFSIPANHTHLGVGIIIIKFFLLNVFKLKNHWLESNTVIIEVIPPESGTAKRIEKPDAPSTPTGSITSPKKVTAQPSIKVTTRHKHKPTNTFPLGANIGFDALIENFDMSPGYVFSCYKIIQDNQGRQLYYSHTTNNDVSGIIQTGIQDFEFSQGEHSIVFVVLDAFPLETVPGKRHLYSTPITIYIEAPSIP